MHATATHKVTERSVCHPPFSSSIFPFFCSFFSHSPVWFLCYAKLLLLHRLRQYTSSVHRSRLPNRLLSARLTIGDQCLCALLRISWNLVQMILNNFVLAFPLYHFTVFDGTRLLRARCLCCAPKIISHNSIICCRQQHREQSSALQTHTHTLSLLFFHVDFLRADSIVSSALCHPPKMCIIARPLACLPAGRAQLKYSALIGTSTLAAAAAAVILTSECARRTACTTFSSRIIIYLVFLSLVVLTLRGWPLGVCVCVCESCERSSWSINSWILFMDN